MTILRFRADALKALGARILAAAGAPEDVAVAVSRSLVAADLSGHESHGVLRIPQYLQLGRDGVLEFTARPKLVSGRDAIALVSGEWGFGQLTGRVAMEEAVRRAHQYGVGAAGAVRCNHLGRLGEYAEQAAAEGCVGMVWVGGLNATAVPHGGRRRVLGTNPMAVGFPIAGEPAVVHDFATTMIPVGAVMAARIAKQPLPPGCIVDRDGRPATDPDAYFNGGALLPFGGHKGYGLSVIIELLGQSLTGADDLHPPLETDHRPGRRRSGALFVAIDAGAFHLAARTKAAAQRTLARLRDVPAAPGADRVRTPGERAAAARGERAEQGVPLAEATWHTIRDAAEATGVSPHDLPAPLQNHGGASGS